MLDHWYTSARWHVRRRWARDLGASESGSACEKSDGDGVAVYGDASACHDVYPSAYDCWLSGRRILSLAFEVLQIRPEKVTRMGPARLHYITHKYKKFRRGKRRLSLHTHRGTCERLI